MSASHRVLRHEHASRPSARRRTARAACSAVAALLLSSMAWAADGDSGIPPLGSQQEMDLQTCLVQRPDANPVACVKEKQAARAARRRGVLDDHDEALYRANALRRCERLPVQDQQACRERMTGVDTQITGSVSGGGLLREHHEIVPAAPGAQAPPPALLPATPLPPALPQPAQPELPR